MKTSLRFSLRLLAVAGLVVGLGACQKSASTKPRLIYMGNAVAPFWTIAEKGALKAGEDFGADVVVRMPKEGASEQKRMVEEALANGANGFAISPADPANQLDLLKTIAQQTNLITQDSDAPDSPRQCFVGMDNYLAGRLCGKLIKEALPKGGTVIFFVGRAGQLNAKQRRQGATDELLDRPEDKRGDDAPDAEVKGSKYTILGTRTDEADFAKAKANAQDALTRYPDIGCMVGLFSYNTPQIYAVVKEADKIGKVQIVGFDEDDNTLRGVQEGGIYATVVQSPYMYGYQSIRILTALAKGDKSVIPDNKFLDVPAQAIKKDDVGKFWADLKKLTGS